MFKNLGTGNFISKSLFGSISFLYLITGRSALAALENPLDSETFAELIANVAKIVAQIGAPIVVIAIIWAGFLFVSSRGNEKKLEDAKRAFFWTIIGAVLLLGAWGLSEAISEFIGEL